MAIRQKLASTLLRTDIDAKISSAMRYKFAPARICAAYKYIKYSHIRTQETTLAFLPEEYVKCRKKHTRKAHGCFHAIVDLPRALRLGQDAGPVT
jgi:hypothetical protein